MYHSNSKQIIWVLRQMTYSSQPIPQKSISFSKKILLAVWPEWCSIPFPKLMNFNTAVSHDNDENGHSANQVPTLPTRLCWLITFKLEGSIVIQLRVVVLVFPPHPHIHPLVSRNVIKWMTKTWGCCRIVHGAKDQKTERNDKKSIGKMRVQEKSLLSLVLPIKKRRGNRKFFLKECHRYVWI